MLSSDLWNEGREESAQGRVMARRAWALQLTMNVFVGVLNDDDDEQDEEDPSANHRVDRGESEQFWRSSPICHEGFWARESANDQDQFRFVS